MNHSPMGASTRPHVIRHQGRRRLAAAAAVSALALTGSMTGVAQAAGPHDPRPGSAHVLQTPRFETRTPGFANPTTHSQRAFSPYAEFTSRWTRADAMQIKAMSDPTAPSRQSSLPARYTMPAIPQSFPDTNKRVWVWDTWTLTDARSNQISYRGWEVIFSLVADRDAGYSFDERHTHARIGYFYRKAGVPASQRPANGGWKYGGHLVPDGASAQIFTDKSFSSQTEWSGSTRIFTGGKVQLFYTDVAFYRNADGTDRKPYDPRITTSLGKIHADARGVWFTGFGKHKQLLVPDGNYYQDNQQNPYVNFRDPFTFTDPRHPGKTFMVFEGNTAVQRGDRACTGADLGYDPRDPYKESLQTVMDDGAQYQMGNIGLAVADNKSLTKWHFLAPLLSANCVTDQMERPQIYISGGKYYLFTISHRSTYAHGLDGPDGVYGFVGKGVRSDFEPLNRGSGLALGNPTNLNFAPGTPYAPDYNQSPYAYQSYSHYVQPGGLVESFIDSIGTPDSFRRGGSLAPTVKLKISGATTAVDRTYGHRGLGAYGDIPANRTTPINY
ncbi:Levansucrase [Luteimicrobium xylanilyticum]|uniref:Levansucrase n=2 Tax=Luteimicrobium xylanilyticum TaxID=1133546 RepID=A0A5P9QE56_9MICO|nr:Levansucrase [Luteimicrobium xylanilyticum]